MTSCLLIYLQNYETLINESTDSILPKSVLKIAEANKIGKKIYVEEASLKIYRKIVFDNNKQIQIAPILKTCTILMIGIPQIKVEDLLGWMGKFASLAKFIRIINPITPYVTTSIIIYFDNTKNADEFFQLYNGKLFTENSKEY